MNKTPRRVAVVGASDNPERYAHRALVMLQEHGHIVLPVSPKRLQLPGLITYPDLPSTPPPIDTVTLYVNPRLLEALADGIIAAQPRRVIFNPGTEHPDLARRFREAGIETLDACTLVLLTTGQFG